MNTIMPPDLPGWHFRQVHGHYRVEPGQPAGQVLPVGRADPAAFPFVVLLVDPVECQLLPVDVQATYD
jgi:hypothetical protein